MEKEAYVVVYDVPETVTQEEIVDFFESMLEKDCVVGITPNQNPNPPEDGAPPTVHQIVGLRTEEFGISFGFTPLIVFFSLSLSSFDYRNELHSNRGAYFDR
jgi:hypothetical protein